LSSPENRRPGRSHRLRKDYDHESPDALLRRAEGPDSAGRRRCARLGFAVAARELRRVLQEIFLFSGSVAGNIRLGREDISDERVRWRPRKCAPISLFGTAGTRTNRKCAERGAGYLLGRKQLISFARALAFDSGAADSGRSDSSIDTETGATYSAGNRAGDAQPYLAGRRASSLYDSAGRQHHRAAPRRNSGAGNASGSARLARLYWKLYKLQSLILRNYADEKDDFI